VRRETLTLYSSIAHPLSPGLTLPQLAHCYGEERAKVSLEQILVLFLRRHEICPELTPVRTKGDAALSARDWHWS